MFNLARMGYDDTRFWKINDEVSNSSYLDLSLHRAHDLDRTVSSDYKLCSYVSHHGNSMGNGHYTFNTNKGADPLLLSLD